MNPSNLNPLILTSIFDSKGLVWYAIFENIHVLCLVRFKSSLEFECTRRLQTKRRVCCYLASCPLCVRSVLFRRYPVVFRAHFSMSSTVARAQRCT